MKEEAQAAMNAALLSTLPVTICPPSGGLPGFATSDEACRLVVANDGVWLQARTAALQAAIKVYSRGPYNLPTTPFGAVAQGGEDILVEYLRTPDFDWLGRFLREARRHWPNECAGFVIYDGTFDAWRLAVTENYSVSKGHVHYRPPSLSNSEIVVMDLHSHGGGASFFSSADDEDDQTDAGSLKLAFVLGRVHTEQIEIASRLVAFGCIGPTEVIRRQAPADATFSAEVA